MLVSCLKIFDMVQAVGRLENMVGWYHSHPGYGCWLSGIDVSTQSIQQQYQEPFLAIVVDPHRTIAAGKVEIGAFRTYPEVHHSLSLSGIQRRKMRLPVVMLLCGMDCSPKQQIIGMLHAQHAQHARSSCELLSAH